MDKYGNSASHIYGNSASRFYLVNTIETNPVV